MPALGITFFSLKQNATYVQKTELFLVGYLLYMELLLVMRHYHCSPEAVYFLCQEVN